MAKANGKFTDPVAAVNSITEASASNPYLMVIGPGVYTFTSQLQMKEYVEIPGSGCNVTRITGAISTEEYSTSAVIIGASNAAICSLKVENIGGRYRSIALYDNSTSPTLTDVTATASGGTYSYGVSISYSNQKIRHSTMKGDADGLHTGSDSTSTVSQSTIIGGVGGTGTKTCVDCDNGRGIALNGTCQ